MIGVKNRILFEGYSISPCLFFIDRDFDDYLGTQEHVDSQTYMTDNYSIENDMVSDYALSIVLTDVIRISHADPEYSRIRQEFTVSEQKFAQTLRPLMAWIVAARQSGLKPVLKDLNMKKVILLEENARTQKKNGAFAICRQITIGSKSGPTFGQVALFRRRFAIVDRKKWLRGKFELWFFQSAVLKLISEASERRVEAGGKPYRISSSLRDARLFELLGGRVPPPISLVEFLRSRLLEMSKKATPASNS